MQPCSRRPKRPGVRADIRRRSDAGSGKPGYGPRARGGDVLDPRSRSGWVRVSGGVIGTVRTNASAVGAWARSWIRASRHRWVTPGLALFLVSVLVVGCSTRGCGDAQFATPLVQIYNRTVAVVRFGEAWAPACNWKTDYDLAEWPSISPPRVSPPPGAVPLSVDIGVPSDYNGNVSIIVSEAGVEVVRGNIDERDLPRCAGSPPSPTSLALARSA